MSQPIKAAVYKQKDKGDIIRVTQIIAMMTKKVYKHVLAKIFYFHSQLLDKSHQNFYLTNIFIIGKKAKSEIY